MLFESLAIFAILAMYTAFWVLKKRKFGVLGQYAPIGAMKHYLTEMIGDAEQMRAQLFGLLGMAPVSAGGAGAGAQFTVGSMTGAPTLNVSDPDVLKQLQAMEAKLAEQAKLMETIVGDKARLEKELEALRGGGDSSKLQEKIAQLEGRLAEYSVIEDDLANLKKLQQENTQLKSQLGMSPAAPVAAAAAEVATPVAAAVAEAVPADEPVLAEAVAAPSAAEPAIAEPALETPAAAVPAAEAPAFENLVDQVEQSLTPTEALPPMAAPTPATSAPAPSAEKNDADLVAEFEKMLSG